MSSYHLLLIYISLMLSSISSIHVQHLRAQTYTDVTTKSESGCCPPGYGQGGSMCWQITCLPGETTIPIPGSTLPKCGYCSKKVHPYKTCEIDGKQGCFVCTPGKKGTCHCFSKDIYQVPDTSVHPNVKACSAIQN